MDFVVHVPNAIDGSVETNASWEKALFSRKNMKIDANRGTRKRYCAFLLPLLILTLSLTSCAATGEPFERGEKVPGKASLYIYYAHGPFSSSLAWPVYLDETKLTELWRGGYCYSTVLPGVHTISMKVDSVERSLNVSAEPDGTYYLRLRYETDFLVPTWVFEPVLETEALDELKAMKRQP